MIEEREDDRGVRVRGRQVERVAGEGGRNDARAERLVHREDSAGGDTQSVRYATASLRRRAGSQSEDDCAPGNGYQAILKENRGQVRCGVIRDHGIAGVGQSGLLTGNGEWCGGATGRSE